MKTIWKRRKNVEKSKGDKRKRSMKEDSNHITRVEVEAIDSKIMSSMIEEGTIMEVVNSNNSIDNRTIMIIKGMIRELEVAKEEVIIIIKIMTIEMMRGLILGETKI